MKNKKEKRNNYKNKNIQKLLNKSKKDNQKN